MTTKLDIYHPDEEDYLPYQYAGIEQMLKRRNVLLADDPGLGKTIQALGLINVMKYDNVLVVCPNMVRLNWVSEANRWLSPEMRDKYEIEQCTSSAFFPSNFVIASYEGVTKWSHSLSQVKWDLFIIDEAHWIKNRDAKRSKAVYEKLKFDPSVTKTLMLTGTPICNYPYEIAPLLHYLDDEQWPSINQIVSRYAPYGNKYGYHLDELNRFLREGKPMASGEVEEHVSVIKSGDDSFACQNCGIIMLDEEPARAHVKDTHHNMISMRSLRAKVERIEHKRLAQGLMIRRLKKDVLPELPRKRRRIVALPAEGELLELVQEENALWAKEEEVHKALNDALDALVPEMEHEHESSFENAIDAMRQTRRYFFDEIALIRHKLAKAKVPYVCEYVDNVLENKEKLVLFFHHRDVGEAFLAHFGTRSVLVYGGMAAHEVEAAKSRFWTDDSCELFIASIKMMGVGVNLQVASNIVFAELDWVPGVITQAEDRCHRIGQEKSLLVEHLVAQDSMDSVMAKRIVTKQKSIRKALDKPLADPGPSILGVIGGSFDTPSFGLGQTTRE
jgi:SWI/SNF-related matrix-associated actin-dependent regulator of chromatin subfamily A-like protein 1